MTEGGPDMYFSDDMLNGSQSYSQRSSDVANFNDVHVAQRTATNGFHRHTCCHAMTKTTQRGHPRPYTTPVQLATIYDGCITVDRHSFVSVNLLIEVYVIRRCELLKGKCWVHCSLILVKAIYVIFQY